MLEGQFNFWKYRINLNLVWAMQRQSPGVYEVLSHSAAGLFY